MKPIKILLATSFLLLTQCATADRGSRDAGRLDSGWDGAGPPAPGDLLAEFSGDIGDDGTRWGRPLECGTSVGTDYFYSLATFENPVSRDLRVTVEVDWTIAGRTLDGFLHVYRDYDPRRTDLECLGSNDDWMGVSASRVVGITVPAGGRIQLVLSSVTEARTGRYSASIIAE